MKSTIFNDASALISPIFAIVSINFSTLATVLSSTYKLLRTLFTFPIEVATWSIMSWSTSFMAVSPLASCSSYSPTVAAALSFAFSTIPVNKLITVSSALASGLFASSFYC